MIRTASININTSYNWVMRLINRSIYITCPTIRKIHFYNPLAGPQESLRKLYDYSIKVWKNFHRNLKMHPYIIVLFQELSARDCKERSIFKTLLWQDILWNVNPEDVILSWRGTFSSFWYSKQKISFSLFRHWNFTIIGRPFLISKVAMWRVVLILVWLVCTFLKKMVSYSKHQSLLSHAPWLLIAKLDKLCNNLLRMSGSNKMVQEPKHQVNYWHWWGKRFHPLVSF